MQKTLFFIIGIITIFLCFSLFAQATEMVKSSDFPNDENGQVLRQMQEKGDDLTKPRNVDFVVVLPNQGNAKKFAAHFKSLGYITSIENSNTVKTLPWDVTVVKNMVPTHAGITNFEKELSDYAASLGGRNDGWGCFAQ